MRKLADFNLELNPDHPIINHAIKKFSDLYNFSVEHYEGNRTFENFHISRGSDTVLENQELIRNGKGIYIILDERLTAKNFRRNIQKIPFEAVVNIGMAGGEEPTRNRTENKSNFHKRIYKHALEALGITDTGPRDENNDLINPNGNSIHHSAAWMTYGRDYNAPVQPGWQQWIAGADDNHQFCLDHWWVKFIQVPVPPGEDKPKTRKVIRTLEDYLILGYMAFSGRVNGGGENYQRFAPRANTAVKTGVIKEIYKFE